MSVTQIIVVVFSLPLLGLGLRSMLAPRGMSEAMHIAPKGAAGLNTVRSVIGGLFLASVTMLALGVITGEPMWLLAVALVMGYVAVGRVLGIVTDGLDKAVLPPLLVELVLGGGLLASYLMW